MEHYENPRNVGNFDKTDKNVGTGLVGAPACGDVMKLQIKVDDDGKIIDAKFKTFGCGSAIASSSLATEWVKGKTLDQAGQLKNTDIAKELCLPPVKLHCSSKHQLLSALLSLRPKYFNFFLFSFKCLPKMLLKPHWLTIRKSKFQRNKSGRAC